MHTNLSKSLLFKTETTRIKRDSSMDSCVVKIRVLNKRNRNSIFTTTFSSTYLFDRAYTESNATRSYTTGVGRRREAYDYDYGDLVVADFNFDGREDFAAKNDSGGNRGPFYSYFLQTSAGSFVLDKFLTERMVFFPDRITKATRTLTLQSERWNERFRTSYRLNAKTGKWREIKYEPVIIQPGLHITE
ncbi:MAG: XAC2610-related protein [Janthinobacterium lividum]